MAPTTCQSPQNREETSAVPTENFLVVPRGSSANGHHYPDGHEEESWGTLDGKIDAVATAVVRSDDPGPAAAYALARLRKVLEYRFELLLGRRRLPTAGGSDAAHQAALDEIWHGAAPA